jgi:hypothetical protein
MLHPRIQAIAHDWVWERGNYEIHVRVITDLELDPNAEGFDRKLVDAVMLSLSHHQSRGQGIVRRVTLTGRPGLAG